MVVVIHPVAVLPVVVGGLPVALRRPALPAVADTGRRLAVAGTVRPVVTRLVVVGGRLPVPALVARPVTVHLAVRRLAPVRVVPVMVLRRGLPVVGTFRPAHHRVVACRPVTFRPACRQPRRVTVRLAVRGVVPPPAVQELAAMDRPAAVTVRPVRSLRPVVVTVRPATVRPGTARPAAVPAVLVAHPAATAARPAVSCRPVAVATPRGRRWRR